MSVDILVVSVIEEIADILELPVEDVEVGSSLVDDLDADSLDLVDVSFSLGKKFGIKLPTKTTLSAAEEMIVDPSLIVAGGNLTALDAKMLHGSPNKYAAHEVAEGNYVSELLGKTLVCHWYELCRAIHQHPSKDGDLLIQEYLTQFIEEHLQTESVS